MHPAARAFVLALALPATLAAAAAGRAPAPDDPLADPLLVTAGYLAYHPDIDFRLKGMRAYAAGDHAEAMALFRRAAFHADKPSQGMIAEMLWNGEGTAQDRAMAYAWMDLAAERGYAGFLGMRERYWHALDGDERRRALEEGTAVYARFGDAAARPRLDAKLRLGRRLATGSRTGMIGALTIVIPGPDGEGMAVPGARFYDPRYWDPAAYQAWQDSIWMKPLIGRVSVGGVEAAGEPPGSRIPVVTPEADADDPDAPPHRR